MKKKKKTEINIEKRSEKVIKRNGFGDNLQESK